MLIVHLMVKSPAFATDVLLFKKWIENQFDKHI